MKLPSTLIMLLFAPNGDSTSVRGAADSSGRFGFASSDVVAASGNWQRDRCRRNSQCYQNKDGTCAALGTTKACNLIANINSNSACTCRLTEPTSISPAYPKWQRGGNSAPVAPVPGGGTGADGEEVNAQFFGNIVGHAKMLCQIVQAIDCWQKGKPGGSPGGSPGFGGIPGFPGFGTNKNILPGGGSLDQNTGNSDEMGTMVELTLPDGQSKLASFDKVLGTVKKICNVIDGGVGELPGLLNPGGGGGSGNPLAPGGGGGGIGGGIPGLIGTIIDLIGNGGGNSGGSGGGLLDGLFGSIFVAEGKAAQGSMGIASEDQVTLYDAPNKEE